MDLGVTDVRPVTERIGPPNSIPVQRCLSRNSYCCKRKIMQVRGRPRRWYRPLCWALLLTASLLCTELANAQSNDTPPATQSQQSSTDNGDNKSSEPRMTKLKIRVTTDADKPVANASVYVRFYQSAGFLHKDKLAEMNFKTNQDGSVKVPEIPQGKILIQVIATGWHTYGKWYDVDKSEESITVKLVPPPHWY